MTKFQMTTRRQYWWPVRVRYPDPDPKKAGQVTEETFNALFEEIGFDASIALDEELAALSPKERQKREHEHLTRIVKGWDDGVVDENKQPVPFSAEALHAALQSVFVRTGLYAAYMQSLAGTDAPKLKN